MSTPKHCLAAFRSHSAINNHLDNRHPAPFPFIGDHMAKLSLINREAKRRALAKKFAERIGRLKAIIDSSAEGDESKDAARMELAKITA
jgi:hypothetical protein